MKTATKLKPLNVKQLPHRFDADDKRVIARPFIPGDESRIRSIIDRVIDLDEADATGLFKGVLHQFSCLHRNIASVFENHFDYVRQYVPGDAELSDLRRQLIGSYFTMEYAIASAALFNPSIVQSHDQSDLPSGSTRFAMSLRATGEGHVSSIVFRRGVIDKNLNIELEPASPFSHSVKIKQDRIYDAHTFRLKLIEMGAYQPDSETILGQLGDTFNITGLNNAISQSRQAQPEPRELLEQAANDMLWLARSNYHLEIPADADPSEIVLFPNSDNESHGMEDARFVRFIDDDGSAQYYGTFTAYNGHRILPELIETEDFRTVKIHTLNGKFAQNKGHALFPRKVNGYYQMICRPDGENLYLATSDNIRFWNDAKLLQVPRFPWEFVQIGNCGCPLETSKGWLLLTHGVGPMRRYCIGASLLDLNDPTKLIGQLAEPLIVPPENERHGYVPNVVYTCGAMIHHESLVIPYAISDKTTTFATIPLGDLLDHLLASRVTD